MLHVSEFGSHITRQGLADVRRDMALLTFDNMTDVDASGLSIIVPEEVLREKVDRMMTEPTFKSTGEALCHEQANKCERCTRRKDSAYIVAHAASHNLRKRTQHGTRRRSRPRCSAKQFDACV